MKDQVNHPDHYTTGGVEAIEVIKMKLPKEKYLGYLNGNVLKYMLRWEYKHGLEDLKKAQWYLNRLIGEQDETR